MGGSLDCVPTSMFEAGISSRRLYVAQFPLTLEKSFFRSAYESVGLTPPVVVDLPGVACAELIGHHNISLLIFTPLIIPRDPRTAPGTVQK